MTKGTARLVDGQGQGPPAWLGPMVHLDDVEPSDGNAPADDRFDLGAVTVWATVGTTDDARRVLRVVQRDADVVVRVRLVEPDRSAFMDELRRTAREVTALGPPSLDDDQRALVRLLRGGLSLRDAASQLHISSRTADRRLADIRTLLGVATTAEVLRRPPTARQ